MHAHLTRQLRRLGLALDAPPSPAAWQQLLEGVSRTYHDADRERYTLERSITLSSSEMQDLNARLIRERDQFAQIFLSSPAGMIRVELDGRVSDCNLAFEEIMGSPKAALLERTFWHLSHADEQQSSRALLEALIAGKTTSTRCQRRFLNHTQKTVALNLGLGMVRDHAGLPLFAIVVVEDVTEKSRLEIELRHAQKLESVGRLSTGIAHEINTPIQFVGDNVTFLSTAFTDVLYLCDLFQSHCDKAAAARLSDAELQFLRDEQQRVDLDYIRENASSAFTSTLDGVGRVARIVQSMKTFAHPDRESSSGVDLNAAIRSTVTVATSELKYVADVVLELGDVPVVFCYLGDLNQVFLNLLVNAAHAIGDAIRGSDDRGTIRVRTYQDGTDVVVAISDTGTGIPTDVRARIFDPFFTTKEVGRGTGQGLAMARSVVVEQHGGAITFETELGKGTTFYIRLPQEGHRDADKDTRMRGNG